MTVCIVKLKKITVAIDHFTRCKHMVQKHLRFHLLFLHVEFKTETICFSEWSIQTCIVCRLWLLLFYECPVMSHIQKSSKHRKIFFAICIDLFDHEALSLI